MNYVCYNPIIFVCTSHFLIMGSQYDYTAMLKSSYFIGVIHEQSSPGAF